MTTIATDGQTMAADSQCGDECFHTEVRKLMRATDGAILGYTGEAFDGDGFLKWYEDGGDGAPSVTDDFEGLILLPDARLLCVNGKGLRFFHGAPAAIGSGCRFAYGAMDAGATPEEAVRIAVKRDAFSGGAVVVERLRTAELRQIA